MIILLSSASLAVLPLSNAHTPPMSVPTYAYLNAAPSPVGVGQSIFVNFWLNLCPPTAAGAYGDRWQGFKVDVTKPDGSIETLGPFKSDAVGGAFTTYTPTMLGEYSFVFNFPGQTLAGDNPNPITGTSSAIWVGDYFEPSNSDKVTVTVQQEQVAGFPTTPLPKEYWTRPIQSFNSEWHKISGNWLGLAASTFAATGMYNASGNFNPYTTAPNAPHIVWTKPVAFGGLIGGEYGDSEQSNYYSTSQYEPKFAPIIMNGILYYTHYPGSSTYPSGWIAVDMRTGETVWEKATDEILRTGQIINYVSPNQYGGLAYLWAVPRTATGYAYGGGLYYSVYDAMTGDYILTITNGRPMTLTVSDDGSLIGYYLNPGNNTLNMWNSTECILYPNGHIAESWQWRPVVNSTIQFSRGTMWSVPLVNTISNTPISPNLTISKVASDVILMLSTPPSVNTFWNPGWQIEAGYSAKTGQLLWGPVNRTQPEWTRTYMGPAGDGVYTEYTGETMTWTGYSLNTGEKLWGPTEPNANAWSYYGCQFVLAYGNIYAWDFGGYVNCYDIQTGERLWDWNTGSSGYATPYGVWPLWTFTTGTVADGKLYVPEGHMYSPPLFKGAKQLCLDANTGEKIWDILSFDVTSAPAIADGYMVTLNAYDNQIYCYGKGQTETTVSAPTTVQPSGSNILIQGTVIDQSPGAMGKPAISDADMGAWMEYVYMQQPKPENAKGVPITLKAIDADGNTHSIGTVTSNQGGSYAAMWSPPTEGVYTIIATFEGTESYWPSQAETHVGVSSTSTSPSTTSGFALPSTETALILAAVAVIIAIVAIVVVFLRKQK